MTPELLATCAGGIVMSVPEVLATRDGRRTQMRRALSPQPTDARREAIADLYNHEPNHWSFWLPDNRMTDPRIWVPPYQPGKSYYVREVWFADHANEDDDGRPEYLYRCDDPDLRLVDGDEYGVFRKDGSEASPWRSATCMPRAAARYVVEIVDVRVQRLQEISEEDAISEGAQHWPDLPGTHAYGLDDRWTLGFVPSSVDECLGSARSAVAHAWDRSRRCRRAPWASNPWVYAWTYRLVTT